MSKPIWVEAGLDAPPPSPIGWQPVAVLTPRDRTISPQGFVQFDDGSFASTQGDTDDNLTITWYDRGFKRLGELLIPNGGHGDRTRLERDDRIGLYVTGTWCSIPRRFGKMNPSSVVSLYRSTYSRPPFGARSWFQGEIASLDGVCIRLYGVPFREYGPSRVDGVTRPNIPANLEFYRDTTGKPYAIEWVGNLGRDENLVPVGNRLEPEGLVVSRAGGATRLLVGIVTGRNGSFRHEIYGRRWDGPPK